MSEYGQKILLALQGLIPIAMMDLMAKHGSKIEDMHPGEAEREEMVEILVMADALAAGSLGTKKDREARGRGLATVAKAICYLACKPGGVEFLGRKWIAKEGGPWGVIVEDFDVTRADLT